MSWTETARREYRRDCPLYSSDLTDREWALIEPFMPPPPDRSRGRLCRIGRPRKTDLREVVNAALYMASTGCPPPSRGQAMAAAAEGFPAGLDGAALFLGVARQQAVAEDPVRFGRTGAQARGARGSAERRRDQQLDGENHRGRRGKRLCARRSVAIEWGVDFDSFKPAVLKLPIPPWEARVVEKGRCMSCWGRLVGRIDRRTRSFTGIRCVVCGKTIEGEALEREYKRMIAESVQNAIRQVTGSAVEYDQDGAFVLSLFPEFERETKEEFERRIAASTQKRVRKGWLSRRGFPVGSPGLFFLQAKVLMSSVERLQRVITAGSFGELEPHEDGSATMRLPTGERNDPQFLQYDMSQRLGCTMTAALMSAFACELAMKAIRLTRLDEAKRDHDLLALYEDLPEDSRSRIEAAYPGIRLVLETAKHAFGKWRYFEEAIGERGIRNMVDTEQALALGKAARVILDEAEVAGLTCRVELDGLQNVELTEKTKNYTYKHDFKVVGGESGRPVANGTGQGGEP